MSRSRARSGWPAGREGAKALDEGQPDPLGHLAVGSHCPATIVGHQLLVALVAPGEAERHHRVPVVEEVDRIVHQELDIRSQLVGSSTDIDAEQGEPVGAEKPIRPAHATSRYS